MSIKEKIAGLGTKTLAIIAMFVVVATAATVAYLSNTVTQNVAVSSPLVMTGETLVTAATAGGAIQYSLTTTNNAGAEVWSFPVTQVTVPSGEFTGAEFTQILLQDPASIANPGTPGTVMYNGGSYWDVTSMMKYVDSSGALQPISGVASAHLSTVKLVFDNGVSFDSTKGYVRSSTFDELNTIVIKTSPAMAPGTYTIASCQLYALTGNC